MPVISPSLLRTALHHYEPWGLLQQAWASNRTDTGAGSDADVLAEIISLGAGLSAASDQTLQSLVNELRSRAVSGEPLRDYVAPAFALAREASRRVLGLYHYEVQLLGGLAICRGSIAEMATGEGKTLVQSLAAFARCLVGRGVHVATANSYLAQRDFAFAQPLFEFLGVRVALLPERVPSSQKRSAYAAEITYGTGTEFGFDYLRDQVELMRQPRIRIGEQFRREVCGDADPQMAPLAQRGLAFAIIDEIDSVLIDEATTPLVISGKAEDRNPHPEAYHLARETALRLQTPEDVLIDDRERRVTLTPLGYERAHDPGFPIPWNELLRPWQSYVENALRAEHLFTRDRDYVVEAGTGKIVIVDSFTGRIREGSSWREGLHQAVEAKEKVTISAETTSVAGISRQRFFRLYEGLGGMTGTASEAAGELWRFYQLPVTNIPRHRPSQARELPPRIFRTISEKYGAIAADLQRRQATGQPVLVGCRTIRESEDLSAELRRRGVPHTLLNAKTVSEEAPIIAAAGQVGAITVATNMAGRGTHIELAPEALQVGGLHVVATGLDGSRRIDRQLSGRAARQGQPGSSQCFLSGEDELLVGLLPKVAEKIVRSPSRHPEGDLDGTHWIACFIRAQRKVERLAYEERVSTFFYNERLNESKEKLS